MRDQKSPSVAARDAIVPKGWGLAQQGSQANSGSSCRFVVVNIGQLPDIFESFRPDSFLPPKFSAKSRLPIQCPRATVDISQPVACLMKLSWCHRHAVGTVSGSIGISTITLGTGSKSPETGSKGAQRGAKGVVSQDWRGVGMLQGTGFGVAEALLLREFLLN